MLYVGQISAIAIPRRTAICPFDRHINPQHKWKCIAPALFDLLPDKVIVQAEVGLSECVEATTDGAARVVVDRTNCACLRSHVHVTGH
jgi:hypothetical protein